MILVAAGGLVYAHIPLEPLVFLVSRLDVSDTFLTHIKKGNRESSAFSSLPHARQVPDKWRKIRKVKGLQGFIKPCYSYGFAWHARGQEFDPPCLHH